MSFTLGAPIGGKMKQAIAALSAPRDALTYHQTVRLEVSPRPRTRTRSAVILNLEEASRAGSFNAGGERLQCAEARTCVIYPSLN